MAKVFDSSSSGGTCKNGCGRGQVATEEQQDCGRVRYKRGTSSNNKGTFSTNKERGSSRWKRERERGQGRGGDKQRTRTGTTARKRKTRERERRQRSKSAQERARLNKSPRIRVKQQRSSRTAER